MKLVFPKKISKFYGSIILMVLGMFILLYFTLTSISWGRFDVFNFLVSLIGVLIIILSFKLNLIILLIKKCPKLIQYLLKISFCCFILSFVISQSIIMYNMHNTSKDGADYLIVLGCQVVGEKRLSRERYRPRLAVWVAAFCSWSVANSS